MDKKSTLSTPEHIIGTIQSTNTIIGTLSQPVTIVGEISKSPVHDVEYLGPYIVDPIFETITLETNDKKMTDDVTVNPIAVSRTSNLSGGITVYIGGLG